MVPLLVTLGVLVGFGGVLFLSNATSGVGAIGLGCLLCICARLAQSAEQHKAVMMALSRAQVR